MTNNQILGTGWSFPPEFNDHIPGVVMKSGVDDINESLHILLCTRIGERVMQENYGSNLKEMLFEPLNVSNQTYITEVLKRAILRFEPRITVDKITLEEDEILAGKVTLEIEYTVISTNTRHNIVYPFYQNEGTDITQ